MLGMFSLFGCLMLFIVVGGIFLVLSAVLRMFGWGRGYGYYRPYRRPWFFGAMPFLFGGREFRRREEFYEHRHHEHRHHHHEHHHHHHDGGFGGHHGGHHHGGGFGGGHHGGHH